MTVQFLKDLTCCCSNLFAIRSKYYQFGPYVLCSEKLYSSKILNVKHQITYDRVFSPFFLICRVLRSRFWATFFVESFSFQWNFSDCLFSPHNHNILEFFSKS